MIRYLYKNSYVFLMIGGMAESEELGPPPTVLSLGVRIMHRLLSMKKDPQNRSSSMLQPF